MAVIWAAGSFDNGANLNTVRTNINNFNDEVSISIASSDSAITAVNTKAVTNTADIAAKGVLITNNTNAIAANTSLINTNAPFPPTYDYMVLPATTVVATASGTTLASLTTVSRPTGTYKLNLSTIYSYASTTDSVHFRFMIDGGVWSPTITIEPKDNADNNAISSFSTRVHSAGAITVVIEAWCDNANSAFEIKSLDIAVERVI